MSWDPQLARAVELIYDSVDTDQGWMPLLEELAAQSESSGAHLFLHHHTQGEFMEDCLYGSDAEAQATYQRLAHTDPRWPITVENPGAVINDIDFFTDSFFESTPLYNEVMKWNDARYSLTANLPLNDEMVAGFALLRAKSVGGFEEGDSERLQLLLEHIVRALRLQRRLRELESDAANVVAALDRLPAAALIVSESLEIICLNRQAEVLLKETEPLRVRHGKLLSERSSEASALRRAVSDAMKLADGPIPTPMSPPQVVDISRYKKPALEILAIPLRPRFKLRQNTGSRSRVMLMIYDPESTPRVEPLLLERLFDLTTTEAFVAARLADGKSITDIAEERRCSESTVRTHVKHIFQKTHTNRQSELVQLILSSPAIAFGE